MGDEAVRLLGASEYFNWFDGWVRRDDGTFGLSTLNSAEKTSLQEMLDLMDAAVAATPDVSELNEDVLVASGWPQRIAPKAVAARELFARRGLFSEDREEIEPGISA